MNKKVIVTIIVLCMIGVIGFFVLNNKGLKDNSNNRTPVEDNKENDDKNGENNMEFNSGKVLVVYYSASNNTKSVAEKIASNLNADLFEIEPLEKYTSADLDWTNEDSRVSSEHQDETLRNVKLTTTKVDNWDNYDTVFIGYPIWWGIAAWPANTFVKENDWTNKTVIPFCTSASSGLGQSGELLKEEAKGGNWLEGHRFSSGASNDEIKTWIDSLK